MLSRDLLPLERAVYRAAREQLSSDNQAEQAGFDAEQRDRAAAAVVGPIIDDPALYRLIPERHSDAQGRIYDEAYQDVLRATINDLYYFGPLEDLLYDESLSEIMVNAPDAVWIERDGRLYLTDVCFEDDDHVKFIIDRIAAGMNRRCDEASPLCDCTIVRPGTPFNGSRVNASLKGVAVDHNVITIRKFRKDALTPEALMANGSFDRRMLEVMRAIVEGRMSTIVAGGTGSGKTTLLNAISLYIPHEERIITIEDTPELRLNQPHVIRMETRDANVEGKGLITYRDLVTNALRQRPDRIIVGECRDAAAFDMLQAMTTGHDGSLTTIHADNCREVPVRLRTLVQQANTGMSSREILEYISQAIDFIIYTERSHGVRRVTEISEVQGMQGDVVTIAPIIRFEHDPNDPEHSGWFVPTGERFMRRHIEKMANEGVYVNDDWFNPQAVF